MAYIQQTYFEHCYKTELMITGSRQKLSTLLSPPELSTENVPIERDLWFIVLIRED